MTLWLQRDGSDGVCWCKCESVPAAIPNQWGCPWCGCGWLFACSKCRKSFMFSRAVEFSKTPRELAIIDMTNFLDGEKPDEKLVAEATLAIEEYSSKLQTGRRYVFLDEQIVHADLGINGKDFVVGGLVVDGTRRRHVFQNLPHLAIAENKGKDFGALGDQEYWLGGEWRDPAVTIQKDG